MKSNQPRSPSDRRDGPDKPPPLSRTRAAGLARFRDLPVFSVGTFDSVTAVKGALQELEQTGRFFQAAILADAMGRDDRIVGVMSQRVDGFLALPLEVSAASASKEDEKIAQEFKESFWKMFPQDQLAALMRDGIRLGLGLAQVTWEERDGRWWPLLRSWSVRFVSWNTQTRSYWVTTDGQGQVEVVPGDGQWVLFVPYGAQRGWMEARVRCLAVPWLIRQWGMRDWARHSEVMGIPVRKAIVPIEATDEDKNAFLSDVAALASESCVKVEQSSYEGGPKYDVELVEASGSDGQAFDRLVQRADTNIAVAIIGQNLTTEVKGGSLAAASVHQSVRADIIKSDGRALPLCLQEQVVDKWAELNFGSASRAPKIRFNTEPPEDLKTSAETMIAVGDGVTKVAAAGIPVDSAAVAARFSIPVRDVPEGEKDKPGEVFGYHLQAGILSRNEVRRKLGFEPLPGPEGDELVGQPSQADLQHETEIAKAKASVKPPPPRPMAKADARPELPKGAMRGQLYVDALGDDARDVATKALRPNLDALLSVIRAASSYEEVRTGILAAFKDMDDAALADVLEKSLVLAELDGRFSALEDL